jgi:hypothetical protein
MECWSDGVLMRTCGSGYLAASSLERELELEFYHQGHKEHKAFLRLGPFLCELCDLRG